MQKLIGKPLCDRVDTALEMSARDLNLFTIAAHEKPSLATAAKLISAHAGMAREFAASQLLTEQALKCRCSAELRKLFSISERALLLAAASEPSSSKRGFNT